jgi:AcrR family transcriptional regulator
MAQTSVEDTKDRILEAAGPIFAEKGFRNATVREICQAAQANLAAINYHFGDKERLYIEAVKRAHRARMDHATLPDWPPGTAPAEKLHGFVYMFLLRMLADDQASWHTHLMLRELAQPTAACAELVREFIRPHFDVLMSILAELVPPATSEIERHQIAFSVVGQCLHYRVAQPIVQLLISAEEYEQYDAERLAEHISHWTLTALGIVTPMREARR